MVWWKSCYLYTHHTSYLVLFCDRLPFIMVHCVNKIRIFICSNFSASTRIKRNENVAKTTYSVQFWCSNKICYYIQNTWRTRTTDDKTLLPRSDPQYFLFELIFLCNFSFASIEHFIHSIWCYIHSNKQFRFYFNCSHIAVDLFKFLSLVDICSGCAIRESLMHRSTHMPLQPRNIFFA